MTEKTTYDELIEDPCFDRLMAQEDFILEVTEAFCEVLEKDNIKRNKLAEMLGKTKGYVSQILNGSRNITLRTMSDIAYSLGYNIEVRLAKKSKRTHKDTFNITWDGRGNLDFSIPVHESSDDYGSSCQRLERLLG